MKHAARSLLDAGGMNGKKIALLAGNRDTARTVSEYLMRAGARVRGCDVEVTRVDEDLDAAIVFPDDFARHEAAAALDRLASLTPVVIVTSEPASFAGRARVVLRKPAWGWMLLEAVRRAWSETGLGGQA